MKYLEDYLYMENKINKAYAEGILAGQRQLAQTIEKVHDLMYLKLTSSNKGEQA